MVPHQHSVVRGALEWAIAFLIALVVLFLIRSFVVEAYRVPTGSMETTIEVGDMLFGQKVTLELGQGVEPGDIVVFENPDGTSDHDILVKRVIATGGDTVDLEDGHVVVNGEAIEEPYATGSSYPLLNQASGVTVAFPYTVPEGSVWVMGDNRENSADSRYFGAVPEENLVAVVFFRYWPLDRLGGV